MKLFLAFGVVVLATSVGVVNFTNVCRLEAVTLNGEAVNDWPRRFDMLRGKSLFRQPLDSLARVQMSTLAIAETTGDLPFPKCLVGSGSEALRRVQ